MPHFWIRHSAGKNRPTKWVLQYLRNFTEATLKNSFAAGAIKRLLKETPCPWILLSYSSGGRAAAEELNESIERYGKLVEIIKENVTSSMKWTHRWARELNEPNKEFLFLIRK